MVGSFQLMQSFEQFRPTYFAVWCLMYVCWFTLVVVSCVPRFTWSALLLSLTWKAVVETCLWWEGRGLFRGIPCSSAAVCLESAYLIVYVLLHIRLCWQGIVSERWGGGVHVGVSVCLCACTHSCMCDNVCKRMYTSYQISDSVCVCDGQRLDGKYQNVWDLMSTE